MNIAKDIKTVVDLVREERGTNDPYYLSGHRLEISKRLSKKEAGISEKYKKYPLIALNEMHSPLPEREGNILRWNLNIAILARTKPTDYSLQREEKVFEPILDPLYDLFIKKLKESGLFFWAGEQDAPQHQLVRRKFYGITSNESNTRYIFPDPLDAIEIIDLQLSQFQCN